MTVISQTRLAVAVIALWTTRAVLKAAAVARKTPNAFQARARVLFSIKTNTAARPKRAQRSRERRVSAITSASQELAKEMFGAPRTVNVLGPMPCSQRVHQGRLHQPVCILHSPLPNAFGRGRPSLSRRTGRMRRVGLRARTIRPRLSTSEIETLTSRVQRWGRRTAWRRVTPARSPILKRKV
jgi:hypothetical protein